MNDDVWDIGNIAFEPERGNTIDFCNPYVLIDANFLVKNDVMAISEVDTRQITSMLREKGAMNCCIGSLSVISEEDAIKEAKLFKGLKGMDLAQVVSSASEYEWNEGIWPENKKSNLIWHWHWLWLCFSHCLFFWGLRTFCFSVKNGTNQSCHCHFHCHWLCFSVFFFLGGGAVEPLSVIWDRPIWKAQALDRSPP